MSVSTDALGEFCRPTALRPGASSFGLDRAAGCCRRRLRGCCPRPGPAALSLAAPGSRPGDGFGLRRHPPAGPARCLDHRPGASGGRSAAAQAPLAVARGPLPTPVFGAGARGGGREHHGGAGPGGRPGAAGTRGERPPAQCVAPAGAPAATGFALAGVKPAGRPRGLPGPAPLPPPLVGPAAAPLAPCQRS